MFKSVDKNLDIIDNENCAGTIYSQSVDVSKNRVMAFQFIWSGTPTGSIDVEISIDGDNWTSTGISATGAEGSAGSEFVEILSACRFARAKYVHTSGSGNITVHYSGTRSA